MVQAILGRKIDQTQKFLSDGTRIPVTEVRVTGNTVFAVRTVDKNGYDAIQLGIGEKKNPSKAQAGNARGAKVEKAPLFLREVQADGDLPELGAVLNVAEILKPGDIVNVQGMSKGKGYAGGVKRYHFKGGPRTHGQSDRERAPGSIGQTTTPGRVYKGKRMAGRMGHENVTVKNLTIVDVIEGSILIKGLIPGIRKGFVIVKKVGEHKKFVPLYKEEIRELEQKQEETVNAS